MKAAILRCFPLLLIVSSIFSTDVRGQLLNGRLVTSVYAFERFDSVDISRLYTRGFQSLYLDLGKSEFSLHTHLQAASLLQRELTEEPTFRSYHLYGRWRNIADAMDISFGRLPFFAGIGNGVLDGALMTFRTKEQKIRITLYGGGNTPGDLTLTGWQPLSTNYTVGGQVVTTLIPQLRLGVSYFNRQRERTSYWTTRADSFFDTVSVFVAPPPVKENLIGADASYTWSEVTAYGRFDYNIEDDKVQRGQLGLRYLASDDLSVTADFIHRAPRITSTSFFAFFNPTSLTEFEGGVDYRIMQRMRTFVRGAYVRHDDETSFRYTAGIAHENVSLSFRGSSGYAGELVAVTLEGVYPLLNNHLVPTAGLAYYSYKLSSSSPTMNAFSGSLGTAIRPLQTLSLDVQGHWVQNRIYRRDLRILGKLTFWFSEQLRLLD